ncbi:MAG: molybdopterin dinucleotide binding domain-containing protein [Bacillota bacterium]
MATYVGPPNGDGNDGGNGAYPLRLLSPRRIDHLHSQFYERVLSPGGLPVAYLSRGDLAAAGMVDGDTARMESAYGAIEVLLKETGDVPPGVALMYEGGSVIDGKGANLLTPQGETDMGHGAVFYDTFVRVVC